MFGFVERKNLTTSIKDADLKITYPSLKRHIFEPNKRDGFSIDVFAQTWSVWNGDVITETFRPAATDYQAADGRSVFDAYELVSRLRQRHEREHACNPCSSGWNRKFQM